MQMISDEKVNISAESHFYGLSSIVAMLVSIGLTFYIHYNQIVFGFWPLLVFTTLSTIPVLIHSLGECKNNTVGIVLGIFWGAFLAPVISYMTQHF